MAIAARAVGQEEEGEAAGNEMQEMLARHDGQPWYPAARATWDAWTERVLAATDSSEVDAMMSEVLPLYTADPDRPEVRRLIEDWRREGVVTWPRRRPGRAACGRRSTSGRCSLR